MKIPSAIQRAKKIPLPKPEMDEYSIYDAYGNDRFPPKSYGWVNYDGFFDAVQCREGFHDEFFYGEIKSFFFGSNEIGNVIHFIRTIESKLKLKKSQQLKFNLIRKNGRGNGITITLSNWWKLCPRIDFLTIALRIADKYDGENFEEVLNSDYFKDTPTAVKRFLSGFTRLKKSFRFDGWHSCLSDNYWNNSKPWNNLVK